MQRGIKFRLGGLYEAETLDTKFPLPTLLYAGYSEALHTAYYSIRLFIFKKSTISTRKSKNIC